MKKKEDGREEKRKRRNELVRRRKKMKGGVAVIVIVHLADAAKPVLTRANSNLLLLDTKAGNAVDPKAYTRKAAAAVLLLPSLQSQIIKILAAATTTTISVLNPCKKLAARKSTNAHTVVLYSEEKEVPCAPFLQTGIEPHIPYPSSW